MRKGVEELIIKKIKTY